jgi:hypothetical protein
VLLHPLCCVQGWIPLHVIGAFNRVRMLTPDPAVIISAMQASSGCVKLSASAGVQAVQGALLSLYSAALTLVGNQLRVWLRCCLRLLVVFG